MIADSTIQNVKSNVAIENIIIDYVDLTKRGSALVGLCPFHNEKSPSFYVSPSKNMFKCFGCGESGDTITFLMKYTGMTFIEAIEYIANKINIVIIKDAHSRTDFKSDIEILKNKCDSFMSNTYDINFKNYVFEKNISPASQTNFLLGYDPIKNKIIFPIHNDAGKIVAFAERKLNSDPQVPKYINSPESNIYKKSKTLYGLNRAKIQIRKSNNCILVEGYTDVIAMHQINLTETIATCGTAFTLDQAHLIRRHCNRICLMFDGDDAGVKATRKAIDISLQAGLNCYIIELPQGHDPASFIQEYGSEGASRFIANITDFLTYLVNIYTELVRTKDNRSKEYGTDILRTITYIEDPIEQHRFIHELALSLDIKYSILANTAQAIIHHRNISKYNPRTVPKQIETDPIKQNSIIPNSVDDASRQGLYNALNRINNKLFHVDDLNLTESELNDLWKQRDKLLEELEK